MTSQPPTQPQPQSNQPTSPLSSKLRTSISGPSSSANDTTTHASIDHSHTIPLDSPLRVHPIHPSLSDIKLPSPHPQDTNPLTLKPFTPEDLKAHNYAGLRAQHADPGVARAAIDVAVAELRGKLDEAERRMKEVEREMEEKEKTRELERKVWLKSRGDGTGSAGLV